VERTDLEVAQGALHIDASALAKHLAGRLPGFAGGELRVRKFSGGQSNPTYKLETDTHAYVLRKKPPGTLLPTAHMIEREFRVFAALAQSDVPVPTPHYYCEDTSVIGTAFFVMSFVSGRIFWDPTLPSDETTSWTSQGRRAVYDEMTRVLAALHRAPYERLGLGDYGKPGNYFARQLRRWTQQYEAARTDPVPTMDSLIAWLPEHIPVDDTTTLVHGDYRIDNMIFHEAEARVLAVLDWELSTLGHPLADLAYACMPYHIGSPGRPALSLVAGQGTGIPTEQETVARYCELVGRARIEGWPFYLAFSLFRYASIVQGVYRRGLDGNASGADAVRYRERVIEAADAAWLLVRHG
jgi:aminoglycoside phosphotransferase (APT) family kinase protein